MRAARWCASGQRFSERADGAAHGCAVRPAGQAALMALARHTPVLLALFGRAVVVEGRHLAQADGLDLCLLQPGIGHGTGDGSSPPQRQRLVVGLAADAVGVPFHAQQGYTELGELAAQPLGNREGFGIQRVGVAVEQQPARQREFPACIGPAKAQCCKPLIARGGGRWRVHGHGHGHGRGRRCGAARQPGGAAGQRGAKPCAPGHGRIQLHHNSDRSLTT
jgi:hypothetical protein